MERSALSLAKVCNSCNTNCCKKGHWQSPILDHVEVEKILDTYGRDLSTCFKEILLPNKKSYFIIKPDHSGDCSLQLNCKCKIQDLKPIDCACYPIKAVHSDLGFSFVLDSSCPASKRLNSEFIENAKKLALESAKRFDKDTYTHWLNNTLHWAKETGVELKS